MLTRTVLVGTLNVVIPISPTSEFPCFLLRFSTQNLLPPYISLIWKKCYLCQADKPQAFYSEVPVKCCCSHLGLDNLSLQLKKNDFSHCNSKKNKAFYLFIYFYPCAGIIQKNTQIPQSPSLSPMGYRTHRLTKKLPSTQSRTF